MPKKHPEIEELEELEAKDEEERNRLLEATRKVMLASVGAVGLAQDELEDFVNRLVKRGEIAEKDARKLVKEVTAKRRKGAEKRVEKGMDRVYDRMNIPSKADIEALNEKISILTAKVEELRKETV
ncbi:MAG: phasin family protein [Anaerolineae bacterium]